MFAQPVGTLLVSHESQRIFIQNTQISAFLHCFQIKFISGTLMYGKFSHYTKQNCSSDQELKSNVYNRGINGGPRFTFEQENNTQINTPAAVKLSSNRVPTFDIQIQGLFKDFQGPSNFIFKDQFSTEVCSMSSRTAIFNAYLCDNGTVIR